MRETSLEPESSASANSAIPACLVVFLGSRATRVVPFAVTEIFFVTDALDKFRLRQLLFPRFFTHRVRSETFSIALYHEIVWFNTVHAHKLYQKYFEKSIVI